MEPSPTPPLPRPRDTLAGCMWLPRILAKARLAAAGTLPADYAARFCHATGVDGHFIRFFGLTREDIVRASALPDAEAAGWFLGLPSTAGGRIEEWNRTAVNLGRPGYPMQERFPVALATVYRHLAGRGLETVFDMLDMDEGFRP